MDGTVVQFCTLPRRQYRQQHKAPTILQERLTVYCQKRECHTLNHWQQFLLPLNVSDCLSRLKQSYLSSVWPDNRVLWYMNR